MGTEFIDAIAIIADAQDALINTPNLKEEFQHLLLLEKEHQLNQNDHIRDHLEVLQDHAKAEAYVLEHFAIEQNNRSMGNKLSHHKYLRSTSLPHLLHQVIQQCVFQNLGEQLGNRVLRKNLIHLYSGY